MRLLFLVFFLALVKNKLVCRLKAVPRLPHRLEIGLRATKPDATRPDCRSGQSVSRRQPDSISNVSQVASCRSKIISRRLCPSFRNSQLIRSHQVLPEPDVCNISGLEPVVAFRLSPIDCFMKTII
jgi:hypothetical protein